MRRSYITTPAAALALLTVSAAAQTATPAPAPAPAAQAAAPAASVGSPAKRAKVEQLLELNGTEIASKQVLAGFPERIKQLAARQPMAQAATTPEQKKLTADYLDQMGKIAATVTDWSVDKPKIVDLYAAAFSEADIDAMIVFYSSPAGKAMISKSPELSQKSIEVLQSPINSLAPQFEAATRAYQTSMQNTSPAGTTAPAKPPTLGPETPASKPATAPKK